jgi:hypothetical protein
MTGKKIALSDIREEALLARMPGRRSFWRRRAPEILAAGLYAVLLVVWLVPKYRYQPGPELGGPPRPEWCAAGSLLPAAYLAYFLAGIALLLGPIVSGALAWARERDRGTLEALLLTPMDFSALVSLRFWHALWPWVKLMLYLQPVHMLFSGAHLFRTPGQTWGGWTDFSLCTLMSKPLMAYFIVDERIYLYQLQPAWNGLGDLLAPMALRFANDFSTVFFACAAAYFISVRARNSARALATSFILVPSVLCIILAPHDLMFFLAFPRASNETTDMLLTGYGFVGIAALITRLWLALWLVKRAARNFDWYALGEKPPAATPARP